MKFELVIYMDREAWDALPEAERTRAYAAHEAFQRGARERGEFVRTQAVADPGESTVVRVRAGRRSATPGAYQPAREFVCGSYEVRPVVFASDLA
jgi:hypothetical protein